MRAFPVRLPSGQRYWTVLDEDLQVVAVADAFLRHQRFGRDGAESTTKAYANAIALFLRWCARTGRAWEAGAEHLGLFITWLAHAGRQASGTDVGSAGSGVVLAGPGGVPARSPSRINGVLTAVRGMVARAHVHVVRRDDNVNGAVAKSRRPRAVPLDFVTVQAFDTYEFERSRVPGASGSDFVCVNLFREPVGAPMRLDAVNDLIAAASRRAGLADTVSPHQLRHAFGSNVADAEVGLDVVQELLGHASISSTQVYMHPDEARLRAAVDLVPSPRETAERPR